MSGGECEIDYGIVHVIKCIATTFLFIYLISVFFLFVLSKTFLRLTVYLCLLRSIYANLDVIYSTELSKRSECTLFLFRIRRHKPSFLARKLHASFRESQRFYGRSW